MSGHAPFHAPTWSTEKIVDHIQHGEFSLEGEEWNKVSGLAKSLIKGLLTVNASQRLTIESVIRHPWLTPDSAPATPLSIKDSLKKLGATETAINHTFHAYHQASKGVVLGDPSQNPLARKRKHKTKLNYISEGVRPTTLNIINESEIDISQ